MSNQLVPNKIRFHKQSQLLELCWAETCYQLSSEFLRVHSPSAEVRGHGRGNEVLQTGKIEVRLLKLEPMGNYALKLTFDDGHDTGLYNWDYLADLCQHQALYWQRYLERLAAAGASRETGLIQFKAVD